MVIAGYAYFYKGLFSDFNPLNADERNRTSTPIRAQAPEACASANSATSAAKPNISRFTHFVKNIAKNVFKLVKYRIFPHFSDVNSYLPLSKLCCPILTSIPNKRKNAITACKITGILTDCGLTVQMWVFCEYR